jgi:hypothetical protein
MYEKEVVGVSFEGLRRWATVITGSMVPHSDARASVKPREQEKSTHPRQMPAPAVKKPPWFGIVTYIKIRRQCLADRRQSHDRG